MKAKALAVGIAGILAAAPAWAEVEFSMGGFGTLGVTHSSTKEIDFVASLLQPNGPGLSSSTMFGVDTKVGAQGSANFGNGLFGVIQIVSDHRADNTYTPKVEWANLKYQVTQDSYVRAGRVVAPVFMVSDSRNVAFSQTAVRLPWDVYSLNPITHLDGLDVGSTFKVADGLLSAQLTGGQVKETLYSARVSGKTMMGNLNYDTGNSTFRIGYGKYKLDLGVTDPYFTPYLIQYWDLIDSGVASQLLGYSAPNALIKDVGATLFALGYAYDPGTWIVQAEYARRKADGTIIQSMSAWSAMAGYRMGQFTPYVSYSKMRSIQSPLNPPATAPAACAGIPRTFSQDCDDASDAATLVNGIDAGSNVPSIQSTLSLGVRYDFYRNMALKAQYDRISKPPGSQGQFAQPNINWQSSWINNSKTVNLMTLTLDFLF